MSAGYLFPGHAWAFCCIFVNIRRNSHLDLTTVFLICYVRVLPLNQFVRNQLFWGQNRPPNLIFGPRQGVLLVALGKATRNFVSLSLGECQKMDVCLRNKSSSMTCTNHCSATGEARHRYPPKGLQIKERTLLKLGLTTGEANTNIPPSCAAFGGRIWHEFQ